MQAQPDDELPVPRISSLTRPTYSKPCTLHRRAYLAKDGLIPPLTPEEKAQVAESIIRVKEGLQGN